MTVQVKRRLEQPVDTSKDLKTNVEKQGENVNPTTNYENLAKTEDGIESKAILAKSLVKIDSGEDTRTANYEREIFRDQKGAGELGLGVNVGADEKEKEKEGYKKHAFNQLVSDKISVHRSLKDYRHERYVLTAYILTLFRQSHHNSRITYKACAVNCSFRNLGSINFWGLHRVKLGHYRYYQQILEKKRTFSCQTNQIRLTFLNR